MGHIQLNLGSNGKQQERECPNQRQATAQQAIYKDWEINMQNRKETQMCRTDFGTLWEKARVGCSERTALKRVYYQG